MIVIILKSKTRRYFHFATSVAIALSLHLSHPNLPSVQAQKSIARGDRAINLPKLSQPLISSNPKGVLQPEAIAQLGLVSGQTHLKYKNPFIARVSAFYRPAYFLIKSLTQ